MIPIDVRCMRLEPRGGHDVLFKWHLPITNQKGSLAFHSIDYRGDFIEKEGTIKIVTISFTSYYM